MRASILSVLGLAAGISLAACPYAERSTTEARGCPYADKLTRDAQDSIAPAKREAPAANKRGVMYMNRIGPSGSQLWIANADGSNATALLGDQSDPFDYHPSWSKDGQWIVFTSERRADGQSDLYRVKPNGKGLQTLVATDSFEDSGSLSPDGLKLAYVSTQHNYTANIFVKNLITGRSFNVTGSDQSVSGNFVGPHSFFRPTWSPDGQWLAFSSDANTDWTGHSAGTGWEHTQTLSLYVVRADGSGFRKVVGQEGFCLGSPQWSPDGSRLVYYNLTTEDTYGAHGMGFQTSSIVSQIFSVDVASGKHITQHTFDSTFKVGAHYVGKNNVGYLIKAGKSAGINYTTPDSKHKYFQGSSIRNPVWSPDGSKVVYEVYSWTQRQAERPLFSWDSEWEYRFMDVFPAFHEATGRLATTEKQLGNASSSVVVTNADYSDLVRPFNVYTVKADGGASFGSGTAGAFQPTWSSNGSQLAVGFGSWFAGRTTANAALYLFDPEGKTAPKNVTDGTLNAGFPSFNPDGTKLVYRLWDSDKGPLGLHILDLTTGASTQITAGWDNTPSWSADGELIVFTRQTAWVSGPSWPEDRFDVCTCRPDGSDVRVLTESLANDAHAVWSRDGRILYNSGMYGFRDESPLYDDTFQPYGQIVAMNVDGSNKTMLTDSMWEDSMPVYIPREFF